MTWSIMYIHKSQIFPYLLLKPDFYSSEVYKFQTLFIWN